VRGHDRQGDPKADGQAQVGSDPETEASSDDEAHAQADTEADARAKADPDRDAHAHAHARTPGSREPRRSGPAARAGRDASTAGGALGPGPEDHGSPAQPGPHRDD